MKHLKLNKNQTLYFTAKKDSSIDEVLEEARLIIACTNTMLVITMNGFEMHFDAETDYTMLKEDYSHWKEVIKKMDETAPKAVEAGRKIREVLVTQKPSNLKELKTFCENMLVDLKDVPDYAPLEEVTKKHDFQRGIRSMLFTGPQGGGKTFQLKRYKKELEKRNPEIRFVVYQEALSVEEILTIGKLNDLSKKILLVETQIPESELTPDIEEYFDVIHCNYDPKN